MRITELALVFSLSNLVACSFAPANGPANGVEEPRRVDISSKSSEGANAPDCGGTIWSGPVEDKVLEVTSDEVFLTSGRVKKPLFLPSFRRLHEAQVSRLKSELTRNKALLDSEFAKGKTGLTLDSRATIALKSSFGRFVTFEVEYQRVVEGSPGVHETWWLTLDVSEWKDIEPFASDPQEGAEPISNARLESTFTRSDILTALLENHDVADALSQSATPRPMSLSAVLGGAHAGADRVGLRLRDGKYLTPYSIEHFVFDRTEVDRIFVRLATVSMASANRYENSFLEISLPVAASNLSMNDKSVLWAKDSLGSTRGCKTELHLSTAISLDDSISKKNDG